MIKSGDSRAVWTWVWTLKYLNEPCFICMTLYTESAADQTDHFADVFARENVADGYVLVLVLEDILPQLAHLQFAGVPFHS